LLILLKYDIIYILVNAILFVNYLESDVLKKICNLNGDQMFKKIKQLILIMATFVMMTIIANVLNSEQLIISISTITFIVIIRNYSFNTGTQSIVRTITM
jgi:hypothetical protein